MRPASVAVFAATALLAGTGIIAAQNLMEQWRKDNRTPQKNRYEGSIPQLVSGERIELFSFVRSMPAIGKNSKLLVRYYQPSEKKVVIVARDLANTYRMESIPQAGNGWLSFDPWPTAYKLDSLNLDKKQAGELGVIAYVTSDGKLPAGGPIEVVPADVFSEGASAQKDVTNYVATLRSNVKMRKLVWWIQNSETNDPVVKGELVEQRNKPVNWIIEKQPFDLKISGGKLSKSGKFVLALDGTPWSSDETVHFSVVFYHFEPWGK